ncbi:PLP-dependent aminotransferase family protein [Actinopolymorpha sp. B9G3]|uniref:MocR-like transcription factor YczR n=1 Tax=Actinopolymorpha sp. B9G3 TaxID=3158970 RepID=UPI0032D8DADF
MLDRSATANQLVDMLGSWHHGGPSYRALADRIRLLVLDGRLPPSTRLPSEREFARALGASRTTVAAAYGVLRESGFLASRRGAASRIQVPPGAGAPGTTHRTNGGPGPGGGAIMPAADPDDEALDLCAAALPAPPGMAAAVEAATYALPTYLRGHGYTPLGVPNLRELLAHRYTERGLPTTPDQILVTGGSLQSFALILRAFVSPGDRVLVEHPTYPNVLEAIRQVPARAVPVPLRPDGWDVAMFEATLRQSAPRLAYLVPDFHNPTGLLMSASTRERVAATAARTRTLTVADETLVDLALDVEPDAMPHPLAAYDRHDRVLLVGSTSKCYWGGLGVGWLRAPASLVPTLLGVRAVTDLGTSILSQLTAAELMVRHGPILTERRSMVRSRRAALAEALAAHLPRWRFELPPGGLSLWCELDAPVSSTLAVLAGQQGVRLAEGPRFGTDGAFERFLRLPYALPEADLAEAVVRIADVSATLAARPDQRRGRPRGGRPHRPAADLTPVVT